MSLIKQHLYELQSQSTDDIMNDFPIYKKQLPQIWMEDDKFIIESSSFRYVIEDDLKLLFKLCRRFKSQAIKQTYNHE
jgi:hypothetical protein